MEQQKYKKCPQCETAVPATANRCASCGLDFSKLVTPLQYFQITTPDATPSLSVVPSPTPSHGKNPLLLVLMVLLATGGGIGIGIYLSKGNPPPVKKQVPAVPSSTAISRQKAFVSQNKPPVAPASPTYTQPTQPQQVPIQPMQSQGMAQQSTETNQQPVQDSNELQVVDEMVKKYNGALNRLTELRFVGEIEAEYELAILSITQNGRVSLTAGEMQWALSKAPVTRKMENPKFISAKIERDSLSAEAKHLIDSLQKYDLFRQHYKETIVNGYRYYERYQ